MNAIRVEKWKKVGCSARHFTGWQHDQMTLRNQEEPFSLNDQLKAILPRLYQHARMLTRSTVTADDLVQSTCLRVLDRFCQWDRSGRFDGWAIRVMESIWLNELRQKRQRQEGELIDPDLIATDSFERDSIARLMLQVLQTSNVISDEDLSLILKRNIWGFSYKELAEEHDQSIGTMSSRIFRAREAVKKAVHDLEENWAA